MQDRKPDYRNYSEIDYLLGSELAVTPWNIDRFLQRIPLFDVTKRHIPYLFLLHLVFYNERFEANSRKDNVKKIISSLEKEVIRKNSWNQLFDFLPPYYVARLLFDLHFAGYNTKRLTRNLNEQPGEMPLMDLLRYGDCSVEDFPATLLTFWDQFTSFGESRDNFLFEIAKASVIAQNFKGFYHILGSMKDKSLKSVALNYAAAVYIERNEIGPALKIAEAEKNLFAKSGIYTDISLTLAHAGKIEILKELKRDTSTPEIMIGIMCGMMDYYLSHGETRMVRLLLDEAHVFLNQVRKLRHKTRFQTMLMEFAFTVGYAESFEKSLENVLDNINNRLKDKEKDSARMDLLRSLISFGRFSQARELSHNWHFPTETKDTYWSNHNMNTEFQVMAERTLNAIDTNIRHAKIFPVQNPDCQQEEYFKLVLDIANMITDEQYKEYILCTIALRMANQGFYDEALQIGNSIKQQSYIAWIETSLPLYALSNANVPEAIQLAGHIWEAKSRLAVQLCLCPQLEKKQHSNESRQFMKEWAVNFFQNE